MMNEKNEKNEANVDEHFPRFPAFCVVLYNVSKLRIFQFTKS